MTQVFERIQDLKALLVSAARGEARAPEDNERYKHLRDELLQDSEISAFLPKWLREYRGLGEFWHFIKPKSPTYAGRQEFLRAEFEPALSRFETPRLGATPGNKAARVAATVVGAIAGGGKGAAIAAAHLNDKESLEKQKRVWVVHGRDERLRKGMFDFLYSIGLKPLDFNKARELTGKPMPYVGEILRAAFDHAQAVIVMLTPDDLAKLRPELLRESDGEHERTLMGQARPNVLFEAGMAAVSHPERTIFVRFGIVRPFTDVAGLHLVEMDGSPEKRQELAKRLTAANCPVDFDNTHWLYAGDLGPPDLSRERNRRD